MTTRRITYSYEIVHSGIAIPSGAQHVQLFGNEGFEAYLTTAPWELLPDHIEAQALGRALLGSSISFSAGEEPFEGRLDKARTEVLKQMKERHVEVAALVTKTHEARALPAGDIARSLSNYDVRLSNETPSLSEPLRNLGRVKTALLATVPNAPRYGPQNSRCVYFTEQNRKTFFVGFSISADVTVRTIFTSSSVVKFQQKFERVLNLPNLLRLVADSQLGRQSHVESFLLAWPAMETIVNARWNSHFNTLTSSIGQQLGEPLRQISDRAFSVLTSNNRLGLTEKFILLAQAEYPADAQQDIADFKVLKEIRDKLAHGREVTVTGAHLSDTLALVAKYVTSQ